MKRVIWSRNMETKPFSPSEVQKIIQALDRPAVFLNMTDDWPGRDWTLEHLALCLGEKSLCFRIGKKVNGKQAPLFETECSYVEATLSEFLCWTRGSSNSSAGPFVHYSLTEHWAYADYKYIALLFQDKPTMFKDVMWSDFGYPGRDGRESTLWIGTDRANTPCHLDSYGCNLVFQIQGRKRWHLFPPDDAECLYPTRIPYEESSVFSRVCVDKPDMCRFPSFSRARAHLVTLQPGQVLFVPRHWWHYVESVDPVTVSVNSWIEMEMDDEARVGEALTKTIVSALKTTQGGDNKDVWLNPTEDAISSHDENMQYLNLAVKACMDKWSDRSRLQDQSRATALKRDSTGCFKTPFADSVASFPIPFGPHLIPVTCDADPSQKYTITDRKETNLSKDNLHVSTRNCTNPQSTDEYGNEEAAGSSAEDGRDGDKCAWISTNDMLDCLLHPDVITLVTRLMMDRQRELTSE